MASVPSTGLDLAQLPTTTGRKINVLVVSSVALAFISFWRAAAIVLCDLASSAYYVQGISEQAIGKAAPWFILAIMLFSYAVRAVYVESCTMFTRGGVYKVVKEAMGGTLAKLSVSALMFDYVLTGPISAVAAGQYLVHLFIDMLNVLGMYVPGHHFAIKVDAHSTHEAIAIVSMLIALGITIYFWRANIVGIGESSDKAMKIMKATTVMGILIIGWSLLTLLVRPHGMHIERPPFTPVFTDESKGWLAGMRILGPIGVLMAFGHSLLAMSGEESLAQVNREIAAPKLKNLLRAGFVIFVFSLLLTSLVSFFAVLIIPDGKRVATYAVPDGYVHVADNPFAGCNQVDYLRPDPTQPGRFWGYKLKGTDTETPTHTEQKLYVGAGTTFKPERDDGGYRDNIINGLAHYLIGPSWLKILMQVFVCFVGFLILSGAVNTSIVGSNGVFNRLAEDGVLSPWFLHPQKRFGTTHRLINMVVVMQVVTIIASMGNVDELGEAYAFGVIWSFVFNSLAMIRLRFKDPSPRQYRVPLNIRIPIKPKTDVLAASLAGGSATNAASVPSPSSDDAVAAPVTAPRVDSAAAKTASDSHLMHRPTNEAPDPAVPADGEAPKPVAGAAKEADHIDFPVGILIVFLILISTAMMNLATKKTATIWGIGFTVCFLTAFSICEWISHRRHGGHHEHLEQFNEHVSDHIDPKALGLVHPNPILVAVRGPRGLPVLQRVLEETDTSTRDVVVMTCKVLPPRTLGVTAEETGVDDNDRELLTRIITITEKVGKEVHAMVLPTNNPLYGIACAARDLKAPDVVLGVSEAVQAETQLEQFALAWGSATSEGPTPPLTVRILGPQVEIKYEME